MRSRQYARQLTAPSCNILGLAVMLLLSWAAQHAEAQHSKPTPGLRHGTLLLSSITLLDPPAATGPTTVDIQPERQSPTTESGPPGRCCLTLKAYATALTPASSGAAAQQGCGSTLAPLATFSSCVNSTRSGCTKALLEDSSSSEPNTYQVALLLPSAAHAQQPPKATPGPATAAAASLETCSDPGRSSGVATAFSNVSDVDVAIDGPAASNSSQPAGQPSSAPSTVPRSSMQDMLVTVHAEQEIAGQVYLTVSAQLVQAGVGVVRLAINMSLFSHTWTHPDASVHATLPPAPSNSTKAAPAALPDAPAAAGMPLAEQLPAAGNITAWLAHCPPIPAQQPALNLSKPPPPVPAQQATEDLTRCHAASPALLEGPGAFLPAVLQAQIAADPAVMSAYLHIVLGYSSTGLVSGGTGLSPHTSQHLACSRSSDSTSSRSCSCPALPDMSADVPPNAWILQLQEVLLTCPHQASLSSAVAGAATGALLHSYAQPHAFLSSLASTPAVSAALDVVTSWVQPMVGAAGPDQLREAVLLVAIAAVPALLMCCLVLILCAASTSSRRRQPQHAQATVTAAVQQQQQQPAAAVAEVPVNNPAVQDAWAPQQHVKYETLDQHMQDIDDDIFGYGAPPAPVPMQAAAEPASSGQHGSMLAAIRRASAMAAGEAAGALKDAFMRRHTNQPGGAAGAAAGFASMGAAAGAGRAERDWLEEEDEDRVNQAPESIQRQLAAGGRWQRDGEGRLVRGSWQAVRKSLTAAAHAVMAAVGSGGKAAAAAAGFGPDRGAARPAAAADWEEAGEGGDADALQMLLSAPPGAVVSFTGN